jgi:hypothetical protein
MLPGQPRSIGVGGGRFRSGHFGAKAGMIARKALAKARVCVEFVLDVQPTCGKEFH